MVDYDYVDERLAYLYFHMNLYVLITLAFGASYIAIYDFSLSYLILDVFIFGGLYFACNTVYDCPFM